MNDKPGIGGTEFKLILDQDWSPQSQLKLDTMSDEEVKQKELSVGEERVRTQFNPSNNDRVAQIKNMYAEIINVLEDLKGEGYNPRECATAQTEAEGAAMWAAKAATGKKVK